MRTYNILKVDLTQGEKNTLREAAEIVKRIVDLLTDNKENGHTPWQEETLITETFWDLKRTFERIEEEELLP